MFPLRLATASAARLVSRQRSAPISALLATSSPHSLHIARSFSAAATSASAQSDADYDSPLQDLFDQMEQRHSSTPRYRPVNDKKLACGVPESALRFTTTSYNRLWHAPHVHPNEHAVVLKVNATRLGLNETELDIMRDIVGARLDETRQELRLRSNAFGSRIENKRHLVSMLDRIVSSCQRLAKEIEVEKAA